MSKRRTVILGGDGFCGWPLALRLSSTGHEVTIVDNLSRRRINGEIGVRSLTDVMRLDDRIEGWHALTGNRIVHRDINIASDSGGLRRVLENVAPQTVVHFAAQGSAPYSMRSAWHKEYTVRNNTLGTHNLLNAIVDLRADIHVVHMGTMGVYGYGTTGAAIPEGYLPVQIKAADGATVEREILHPTSPGSIYHLTKVIDQSLFAFYASNDSLRITDLHQGIVWGVNTEETSSSPALINSFSYDGDYGTVLNRFCVQAAVGVPLTLHGTGEQTRAFINLRDSVRCVELAIDNPPAAGERVRIRNQATETHRLADLAAIVSRLTGSPIVNLSNPRKESASNDLAVRNDSFLALGLNPIRLEQGLLKDIIAVARRYASNCDLLRMRCRSYWTDAQRAADA